MRITNNRPVFKPGKSITTTGRASSAYIDRKFQEGLTPELLKAYYPHLAGSRISDTPATAAMAESNLELA